MDELKAQIDQMKQAVAVASESDKPGLLCMISELELLFTANDVSTNQENSNLQTQGNANSNALSKEDEEFLLFQQEIAACENALASTTAASQTSHDISSSLTNDSVKILDESVSCSNGDLSLQEELSALEGMNCKAPFEATWGQTGYYNAIVLSVEQDICESLDTILVRVMFSQPIVEKMLPCPFYMENRCRFEDSTCKFSHGEIVSLASLQKYVEPDFSSIGTGSRVLAKFTDGLWYKATIKEIYDTGNCDVKYDSYESLHAVPLHETSPLFDVDEEDTSSDDDDNECSSSESADETSEAINHLLILQSKSTSPLGEWEKYTRGIGSKLMAKMGYVVGTGLGPRGDGRVEPVDAIVLPPGRSLDVCMELKEKAKNGNIFSAERRRKRQEKKQAQLAEKEEIRKKENESVFNFLNTKLQIAKGKRDKSIHTVSALDLNKESSRNLNKKMLNLGENIKQVNKDIAKTKESIKRQEGRDETVVQKLKSKLECLEQQLADLRKSEVTVESEQRQRNDKKKLAVF